MNDNRGGDSWGYFYLDKNGNFNIKKGIGDMIKEPSREVALHKTVMAHTRKATTGAISIPNCHPFEVDNIIGAHNGMISNHDEMNKQYNRKCEVDSAQIFHHIAENKPLDELTGYGTISYINKKAPGKIFLCKIKNGQLSVMGIGTDQNNTSGLVWSSDESHLEKALNAAGLPSFEYKIEEGALYFVQDGVLFRTEKKLEFKSRTWTTTEYQNTGYYSSRGTGKGYQDYEDDKEFIQYLRDRYGDEEEESDKKDKKDKTGLNIIANYGKPNGTIVTTEDDAELAMTELALSNKAGTVAIEEEKSKKKVESGNRIDLGSNSSTNNALKDPRFERM